LYSAHATVYCDSVTLIFARIIIIIIIVDFGVDRVLVLEIMGSRRRALNTN